MGREQHDTRTSASTADTTMSAGGEGPTAPSKRPGRREAWARHEGEPPAKDPDGRASDGDPVDHRDRPFAEISAAINGFERTSAKKWIKDRQPSIPFGNRSQRALSYKQGQIRQS